MNLPAQFFASDLLWLTNVIFALLAFRSAWYAPWRSLLDNSARINALVGLLLGTFVFWQLNAGVRPGFNFHLIGATLFVLMFGWRIALVALSLVMFTSWIRSDLSYVALGLNGLLMIAIPVLFSELIMRITRKYLPKNFFMFVLVNGFVCGALAMILVVAAATFLLTALSPYTWQEVQHNYLVATPIIVFAEAFTTGAFITAFTVAQPEAVFNFSEKDYLEGK